MRVEARRYGGTRDILPEQAAARKGALQVITETFERFGFGPLETPAIEYATTLMGKYGPDADRLIYRLDQERGPEKELALRYDFTVPLARVVAMEPELQRGLFRRYQVGPVWRRDRPQKDRYREFVQCDVDIVGVASPAADAEIVALLLACLDNLGFPQYRARINNRKLLNGLAAVVGAGELAEEMMRSLDKLDKLGKEGVRDELRDKGFRAEQVARIFDVGGVEGSNDERLAAAERMLGTAPVAVEGIAELREMLECLSAMGVPEQKVVLDLSLARGLDIYTGPVYEWEVPGLRSPSIAGGGRYDNLVGTFCDREVPATGASFGLDRVANAMTELGILPQASGGCQVLVTVFDQGTRSTSLRVATELRKASLNAEVYLAGGGLRAQFGYASRRGIPLAVIIGPDEAAASTAAVKDLRSGSQETVAVGALVGKVKRLLGQA